VLIVGLKISTSVIFQSNSGLSKYYILFSGVPYDTVMNTPFGDNTLLTSDKKLAIFDIEFSPHYKNKSRIPNLLPK